MRPLFLGQMPGVPRIIQEVFNEIEKASKQADIVDIAQAFSVNGSFTETRELNVTAPSTANIAAVLATLIADLQRGGANRTT
jgi:hypothetical protein